MDRGQTSQASMMLETGLSSPSLLTAPGIWHFRATPCWCFGHAAEVAGLPPRLATGVSGLVGHGLLALVLRLPERWWGPSLVRRPLLRSACSSRGAVPHRHGCSIHCAGEADGRPTRSDALRDAAASCLCGAAQAGRRSEAECAGTPVGVVWSSTITEHFWATEIIARLLAQRLPAAIRILLHITIHCTCVIGRRSTVRWSILPWELVAWLHPASLVVILVMLPLLKLQMHQLLLVLVLVLLVLVLLVLVLLRLLVMLLWMPLKDAVVLMRQAWIISSHTRVISDQSWVLAHQHSRVCCPTVLTHQHPRVCCPRVLAQHPLLVVVESHITRVPHPCILTQGTDLAYP
mmetsp:Transcript_50927/g.128495  ORF Transcript_50927/g.128495 Transcript_50927/m.128495 type:complete len:347 (+) Transcript_50927:356-1396(+)